MIDPPRILHTPAQAMACIHLTVPRSAIAAVMGPGVQELLAVLAAQAVTPSGHLFTHHRRRPTDSFDFAICLPVAAAIRPAGRVVPGTLPAATVARTVHRGGYEGLAAAWGALHAWLVAQGRTPRADLWERYLRGPESDPDPATWVTELDQPLVAAP